MVATELVGVCGISGLVVQLTQSRTKRAMVQNAKTGNRDLATMAWFCSLLASRFVRMIDVFVFHFASKDSELRRTTTLVSWDRGLASANAVRRDRKGLFCRDSSDAITQDPSVDCSSVRV